MVMRNDKVKLVSMFGIVISIAKEIQLKFFLYMYDRHDQSEHCNSMPSVIGYNRRWEYRKWRYKAGLPGPLVLAGNVNRFQYITLNTSFGFPHCITQLAS